MRSHTLLGRLALVPLLTLLLSLLTTVAPAARAAAVDPMMGPAGGRSALRRAGLSPAHTLERQLQGSLPQPSGSLRAFGVTLDALRRL